MNIKVSYHSAIEYGSIVPAHLQSHSGTGNIVEDSGGNGDVTGPFWCDPQVVKHWKQDFKRPNAIFIQEHVFAWARLCVCCAAVWGSAKGVSRKWLTGITHVSQQHTSKFPSQLYSYIVKTYFKLS